MSTIENTALEQLRIDTSTNATSKSELGQDDFMELMLTQLRNQDPFQPMENGEFLGQMAQFATVSGIEGMQSALSAMSTSFSSNQVLQAANLVGKTVTTLSNEATLEADGKVDGTVELDSSSGAVAVEFYDASQALVRRIELGSAASGSTSFSWDGLNNDGDAVAPGTYSLVALANNDGKTTAVATTIGATVKSVNIDGAAGATTLETTGGRQIALSDVRRIM